jgi:hypothetical protein
MGFLITVSSMVSMVLVLLSCGSQVQNSLQPENTPPPQQATSFKTSGNFKSIEEVDFYLPEVTTKPRILIFAGTFCSICQGEHRELQALFDSKNGSLPSNVEILTIMVDAVDNSDSLDFKDFTGIQWNPYYQVNQNLRNQLCGAGSATPCTVIEMPQQGIVFQHIGGTSVQELQQITGEWLWDN